jgi:glycosyltransferase involved in cell wall biosynthesis
VIEVGRYVDKVIVCDDGSKDLTGRLGAEVIGHERNMGKGVALRGLFKLAKKYDPSILLKWRG